MDDFKKDAELYRGYFPEGTTHEDEFFFLDELKFVWDKAKNEHNIIVHGVDFSTAALVFNDPYALTDYEHRKGEYRMCKTVNIKGISDEELIRRFSVEINGKRFMRASVLDAMGKRNAERANRKPGDPGTMENPIFKNGHAYVFSSTNRLLMWEDYPEKIPEGNGVSVVPETTETFVLKRDMTPTKEQKKMIQDVKRKSVTLQL